MLTDGLEWCGLLWCFYQLFGLSFWRHPFTAEHPLLRQWRNAAFLQIWWRNKLILIFHFHVWLNYSCKWVFVFHAVWIMFESDMSVLDRTPTGRLILKCSVAFSRNLVKMIKTEQSIKKEYARMFYIVECRGLFCSGLLLLRRWSAVLFSNF